jgi:hypothetical protein
MDHSINHGNYILTKNMAKWEMQYKRLKARGAYLQMLPFFSMAPQPYMGLGLLVSSRFHDHTHLLHTTVGRTPLDE